MSTLSPIFHVLLLLCITTARSPILSLTQSFHVRYTSTAFARLLFGLSEATSQAETGKKLYNGHK